MELHPNEEQEEWKAHLRRWVTDVGIDVVPVGTRTAMKPADEE
jgi:hypothetical protein